MSSDRFAAWIAATPTWLIALTLIAAMILASLAGYALRRRHARKAATGGKDTDDQEGHVLAAVLGLLALLIGFTFALAVDRFESRRGLVLEEANAIGTAYLRTQLLEEPHRTRISRILVDYTDHRLEASHATVEDAARELARDHELVTELWTATAAAFPTIRSIDFSSAYLDSINTVIDLGEARIVSRQVRVPYAVYLVLFIYVIAAAGLHGFTLQGKRERYTTVFLFLLLTLCLMLIIDIDRPASGEINESQGAMEDLRASLQSWPPGSFDAAPAAVR
jgi:hypothetical protein